MKTLLIPFKLILFIITLIILVLMDIFFIRILAADFKQKFLITKKDLKEMMDWTLNKEK